MKRFVLIIYFLSGRTELAPGGLLQLKMAFGFSKGNKAFHVARKDKPFPRI